MIIAFGYIVTSLALILWDKVLEQTDIASTGLISSWISSWSMINKFGINNLRVLMWIIISIVW